MQQALLKVHSHHSYRPLQVQKGTEGKHHLSNRRENTRFCFFICYRRQRRLCCFSISVNILFLFSHLIIFKGAWITATGLCYFESALSASSTFFLSLTELSQQPQDPNIPQVLHHFEEVLPVHLQLLLVVFWFARVFLKFKVFKNVFFQWFASSYLIWIL